MTTLLTTMPSRFLGLSRKGTDSEKPSLAILKLVCVLLRALGANPSATHRMTISRRTRNMIDDRFKSLYDCRETQPVMVKRKSCHAFHTYMVIES